MNSYINHIVSYQDLGEYDEDYANRYVAALEVAFADAYPDADIEITLTHDCSPLREDCSMDIEADEVRSLANLVWDRAEF